MADIEVKGVVEAKTSAVFEWNARPVFVRGREHGRPGSLLRQGHPVVALHPELFEPLRLALDLEDER